MVQGHPVVVVDKHPDGLHAKILRKPKLKEHRVKLRKLALISQVFRGFSFMNPSQGQQASFLANPALFPAWTFFRGLGSGPKI